MRPTTTAPVTTFCVTLDQATAARLEAFGEQFVRATPESIIGAALAAFMEGLGAPETAECRRQVGSAAERLAWQQRPARRENRPRAVLQPVAPGAERQVETVSVEGFFGSFTFVADLECFRRFCGAAEFLRADRSETLFEAISLAIEGTIAAAELEGGCAQ